MNRNRRNFLKTAAACSITGVFLGTKPLLAGTPGDKMAFGLVTYQWGRDWDLPTLIKNCEQTQVLGVELRVEHAHGVSPELTPQQRKEVSKRFSDSPVAMVGMGTNQCYDSPDESALKESIERTKAFIRLSHDVGGSGVKVKPNSFHKDVSREKTIEQIGKSLNEVGKYGAAFGQEIRLEVHGSCCELPTIQAIMEVADHDNVGVCWNCNAQDLQGEGLEYNFNLVRDRFGATAHVRELNETSYPYQQLMDLMVAADYDGWVLLEARRDPPDRVAALIEQREIFKAMVAKGQAKL